MPRHLLSPRKDRLINHQSRTIRVGHRGARAYAPENTIPSITKAASMGCEMVEIDIHMTRDGHLVVFHDDTLDRCSDAGERFPDRKTLFISDFTLKEVKTLDAGSWYATELSLPPDRRQNYLQTITEDEIYANVTENDLQGYRNGRITIPTLEEAISVAIELNLLLNIEIKSIPRMYDGIASATMKSILRMKVEENVLISSFDHRQLRMIRSISERVCTGVLTSNRLSLVSNYIRLLDADAFHPGCYGDYDSLGFGSASGLFDPSDLRDARTNSYMTFVWTCNDENQSKQLTAEHVTGIITDCPNKIGTRRETTQTGHPQLNPDN